MKIAATLGLQTAVQVSSKPQLLAVLHPSSGLRGLECLSVSGRNMRLWKVDAGKAADLLGDAECLAAIEAYRAEAVGEGRQPLLVLAEAVPPQRVREVMAMGVVDGVCVGEELLPDVRDNGGDWGAALLKYLSL